MVALVKGRCLNCVNFVLQRHFNSLCYLMGRDERSAATSFAGASLLAPKIAGLPFPRMPEALVPGQQCSKPHCGDTPAPESRHGPEHRLKTSGHELRLLSKAVTHQEAVGKSLGNQS